MAFPIIDNRTDNKATPKVEHSQPIPIATGPARRRAGSMYDDSSPTSSTSSDSSLNSPTSPVSTDPVNQPRVGAPLSPSTSPILSYFLSSTSPKSTNASTFPFRRTFGPVVVEGKHLSSKLLSPALNCCVSVIYYSDDTESDTIPPPVKHARSVSIAGAWPERLVSPPQQETQTTTSGAPITGSQQGRAAGLLRRLSLGAALRPPVPQPNPNANPPTRTRGSSPPPNSPEADRRIPSPPTTAPGIRNVNGSPRKARRANTMASGTQRPPRAPSPMGERILKGHFDGFN
ncbi:unnamed protein product [Somion occarium]|uniref:Uncharacterized protein n=1 Tax=Somion occarium TaxID=3059160 RepID=A0ABP1ED04_9APHY